MTAPAPLFDRMMLASLVPALLGSMTTNAWLLLRHPHTLAIDALPRRISILTAVIEGLLLGWALLLAVGISGWNGILFAAALAVVSTVVFVLAVG